MCRGAVGVHGGVASDESVVAESKSVHAMSMPRCDSTLVCGDGVVGAPECAGMALGEIVVGVEGVVVVSG